MITSTYSACKPILKMNFLIILVLMSTLEEGFLETDVGSGYTASSARNFFYNETALHQYNCWWTKFGCCKNSLRYPAHGPHQLGCCTSSKFGCCNDNITPAKGPYAEGCVDCRKSKFGCCPDEVTLADSPNKGGCGCQFSQHGCCPNGITEAVGPDYKGCSCDTFKYGCCPDGFTVAQGPNMEGCMPCNSRFGCCPDNITPKTSDLYTCGCEGSIFGCCLDGITNAVGPGFEGCSHIPGMMCNVDKDTGPCSNFTPKWYYDTGYGGCTRFWYGGCRPGPNHFNDEETCKAACVSPGGSGVCYLAKNSGSCQGEYKKWYFDREEKICKSFVYSGCLGNSNRFSKKEQCEAMCQTKMNEELCDKPVLEGACKGNFSRWFYSQKDGSCKRFQFSGCMGNNNRFLTKWECENTCRHKLQRRKTDTVCKMDISSGKGEGGEDGVLARWGYDRKLRSCVPFYYSGYSGNSNNFLSKESCKNVCPSSPSIILLDGGEMLLERGSSGAKIRVSIRATPEANVRWFHNTREVSSGLDPNYDVLEDHSLQINTVTELNSGIYTVSVKDGVSEEPIEKKIVVVVYPLRTTVEIPIKKFIFPLGSTVRLSCDVTGYPQPEIYWFKVGSVRGETNELPLTGVGVRDHHILAEIQKLTNIKTVSNLVIYNASNTDTGNYKCVAISEFYPEVSAMKQIKVDSGLDTTCVDMTSFPHCDKVVKHRYCGNKYFGQYCCKSCMGVGIIP